MSSEKKDKDRETILRRMQEALDHAEQSTARFRGARDDAIREAIKEGMSMYRVAQVVGISQQAVARIRDAG